MQDKKNINFEETIKQLEVIAEQLEKGDLDLDESVSKFERGMELSKECSKILGNAEKRITILLKNDDIVIEENFETQE